MVRSTPAASTVAHPHRSQSGTCGALENPENRAFFPASVLRHFSVRSSAVMPVAGALTAVHATRDRPRPEVMKIRCISAFPQLLSDCKPARFPRLPARCEVPGRIRNGRTGTAMIGIGRMPQGPFTVPGGNRPRVVGKEEWGDTGSSERQARTWSAPCYAGPFRLFRPGVTISAKRSGICRSSR